MSISSLNQIFFCAYHVYVAVKRKYRGTRKGECPRSPLQKSFRAYCIGLFSVLPSPTAVRGDLGNSRQITIANAETQKILAKTKISGNGDTARFIFVGICIIAISLLVQFLLNLIYSYLTVKTDTRNARIFASRARKRRPMRFAFGNYFRVAKTLWCAQRHIRRI